MRTTILAFALVVTACAAAQRRTEYHVFNVPGALESALFLNPLPLAQYQLGSLRQSGAVTLLAVVALAQPSNRSVKGLEVQVEGDDIWNNNRHCKDTAYIDEEALPEFGRRLAELVDSEKQQPRNLIPDVVMAGNKSSVEPQQDVRYVPLEVGSYWTGERYGVYINVPESRVATGLRPGCQFNVPNADVSEFLTLVQRGRRWLAEDSPKTQLSGAPAGSQ